MPRGHDGDARAGDRAGVRHAVRRLDATWGRLRPALVAAGGHTVAQAYDRHVTALAGGGSATALQKQAIKGLDLVDRMEAVFLGR